MSDASFHVNQISSRFQEALFLEEVFPARIRKSMTTLFGIFVAMYLLVGLMFALLHNLEGHLPDFLYSISAIARSYQLAGVMCIIFAFWMMLSQLSWYFNSYYYHVEGLLEEGKTGSKTPYTTPNYETSKIFLHTEHGDLLKSFLHSPEGQYIILRNGIAVEDALQFLEQRSAVINYDIHPEWLANVFTLRDLVDTLIEHDPDFKEWFFTLGIRERELAGATQWVEYAIKRKKQKERYWGKVALGQIAGIGAEFAYGEPFTLKRYSRDLTRIAMTGGSNFRYMYGKKEIAELETILSRTKEANAILVGEEGGGKMDVLLDFARDIQNGFTHPMLRGKRVLVLETKLLISGIKTKQELETLVLKIMDDAVRAGNIIMVIDDLPGFVQGARAYDSEIMSLIDPYLRGSTLQIIATADNSRFHSLIENNQSLMQRFERILLTEPSIDALLRILEDTAERSEARERILFSYPAIEEIAKSAEQYFSNGVMPDKAIDLLDEIVPWTRQRGGTLVKKDDVLAFVHEKTDIPVGEVSGEEREKLMNLEELLKGIVIGQDDALRVIADAMRRSRAGVRDQDKPIGSFLFLGPTGVGKTETAKALAKVFFGDEKYLERIDMSEYQGVDGLERMIGSLDGAQGTLPVMLREHQYGVLLLDEFEKTNPKIHDLFLQIFDEGIFHDAMGKKVNARNTLFIATSNAGAHAIREAMGDNAKLEGLQREIIDGIIAEGRFKPELFNRFDGVIVFRALGVDEYRSIATLMLEKLRTRLREQSVNLVINEAMLEAVMAKGVDPEFGARPMSRAIQEIVEQKVADMIIAGRVGPGQTVEFQSSDFE